MFTPDNSMPLCHGFNAAMLELAHRDLPTGYDVLVNAPATLPDLARHYAETGRLAVEYTGSGGCTMGIPEQHYAFRAWHDRAHVAVCGDFTVVSERELARQHQARIFDAFGWNAATLWFASLVEIEIVAQNIIAEATGEYPVDPRAFAIDWLEKRGITQPANCRLTTPDARSIWGADTGPGRRIVLA
jgi:hypothetical protein